MTTRKRKVDLSEVPVTVADLRDDYEGHVFLYCDVCCAENSAYKGDYFMSKESYVFKCCGESMRLVRRETRLVDVRP